MVSEGDQTIQVQYAVCKNVAIIMQVNIKKDQYVWTATGL